VIRPPPPRYCEAYKYPVDFNTPSDFKNNEINLEYNCQSENLYESLPDLNSKNAVTCDTYKALPGEVVYFYQPAHFYSNVSADSYRKLKYIYRFKKGALGQSKLVLEAIPETVASSDQSMGVKTYAQLEVVESGSEQGPGMCGVSGINGCEGVGGLNRCSEIQTNGKAVLVPINGVIPTDRMIVDSLLNDSNCESWNHEVRHSPDDTPAHTPEHGSRVHSPEFNQVDRDLEQLTQALESEEKCVQSGEQTPLLQEPSAQCTHNETKKGSTEPKTPKSQRKCENDHDYADSGYSDSNRADFKEHVTDHSVDHVLDTVIYSEPEYSSSDMSIKCTGDTLNNALDKYQRTLKRTTNGTDHTVYELSPSDSFYNSADNMHTVGKRHSLASGDGICKIGQSSSSLTDVQRSRQPLSRDTSVSFKKPLVSGAKDESASTRVDLHPAEPQPELTDAEPLVTPNAKQTASSETIPSQLVNIILFQSSLVKYRL
jgi:hypothetical protein